MICPVIRHWINYAAALLPYRAVEVFDIEPLAASLINCLLYVSLDGVGIFFLLCLDILSRVARVLRFKVFIVTVMIGAGRFACC